MRKEYELKDGRPNPYAKRIGAEGRTAILERFLRSEHFVKMDDDLVAAFPNDETVNETLRLALKLKRVLAKPKRSTTRSRQKKTG